MISNDALRLYNLLLKTLRSSSPKLSGNMRSHIKEGPRGESELQIVIEAPYYDLSEWQKTKQIIHTGKTVNGQTDYAQSVNEAGGFGRRNKSMHWVNRVCDEVANIIKSEIGAEDVDNKLPK